MVSLKNFVSFLILATTSSLDVTAASVPRQYSENGVLVREGGSWLPDPAISSLKSRQVGWDDYHRMTEMLADRGLCRYFPTPNDRDTNWPCRQYCSKMTGDYSSRCDGSHLLDGSGKLKSEIQTLHTPDGQRYTPAAECVCMSIPAELAGKISEGIETAGAVICSVWLFSIKQVLEKGSYAIPGGGTVLRVVKSVAKSVRKALNSGKGKEAWASMVRDTCGPKGHDVTMDIERAFEIFKGAPSE
ncbi:hypothetical protein ColLi_07496 [Colletotrichum liriopes]|uniref:Uncharacterized protein n=1 Tax=Colletotrichum liriopes TaxID=708192 RepID=A0AA37LUP3_9PEZI|nr:hypothetical protein ColLi_07496 [Colletotrichum liriopes]